MIAAIAILRGYKTSDAQLRTFAFICMTGSEPAALLGQFGASLGTKLSGRLLMQLPGSLLVKINKAVGFRLVAKAGSSGLINLSKALPLIGGVAGGAFDATITYGVGSIAKKVFSPCEPVDA